METVILVVTLACKQYWSIFHLDVKLAFLNDPLYEVVYATQPLGFVIQEEVRKVYKVHKAIYGLKQAPKAWNKKIDSYLVELGFFKCRYEFNFYIHVMSHDITIIFLYVDGLLVTKNSMEKLSKFKELLKWELEMSDLGNLSYLLGIELQIIKQGMVLHQRKYVKEILKRFRMDDSNPASSPLEPNLKLEKHGENDKFDVTLFKQIIGSMGYV